VNLEAQRKRVELGTITAAEWECKGTLNPASSIGVLRRWTDSQTNPVRLGLEHTWRDVANAVSKDGADKTAVRAAYKRFVDDDLTPVWVASFHHAGRHMGRYMKAADPHSIADGWQWAGGIEELTAWIKERSGELVKHLTAGELESIRAQLYYWTHVEIVPVHTIANKLKQFVGLLPRQWSALEKYRQALPADGIIGPRLETLVEKQRKRMHKLRVRTIARTEVSDAWHAGQTESARQGLAEGVIHGKLHKKWWVSDPCPLCTANAAAGVIPLDQPFPSGHQNPTGHPNCMCVQQLVTK